VRRNRLSDFVGIQRNGKIAMKFEEEGDSLVSVAPCAENQDVLLALKGGRCIRFPVPEVRVFQSRYSEGIRGIKLDKGDELISMSIISHSSEDAETRASYIKMSRAARREDEPTNGDADDEAVATKELSQAEFDRLAASEQFILTVTDTGFGKRTSAYEYRTTHRGGSGIANIKLAAKAKAIVASFPVEASDHILLITDGGKMIRMGIGDIRIAGRSTQGVTLFRIGEGERVISAALVEGGDEETEAPAVQDNEPEGGSE
jgi:DNA gyrase subunit A